MTQTQNDMILAHLKKHGKIDFWQALYKCKSSRLAARIYDLRQDGHNIQKFSKRLKNKKIVAEYKLLGD
tara:strand:+ start:8987 stop:9193 length:207 start_codon:yes stop_codon:yes gene_type:complete